MFSTVTSQISFVNFTDGNRVQMASSMIRQSQCLVNAELPLIIPENAFVRGQSFTVQLAPKDGQVIDKHNYAVVVKYNDDEEDVFILDDLFECDLKIGDTFKKNDVIVRHKSYDPKYQLIKFGVNANVMFAVPEAKTHEDAVIITKHGQSLFEYEYPVKIVYELPAENTLIQVSPKLRPGMTFQTGEEILTISKYSSSLASLFNMQVNKDHASLPFTVTNIFTYVDPKTNFLQYQPESTKKFFETFSTSYKKYDKQILQRYLKRSFSFDSSAFIVIYGVARLLPKPGDKFANLWGNKGVASSVGEKEYHLYDRNYDIRMPIHVVHTPVGIPSRMNLGQVIYMSLGYLLKYVVPKKLISLKHLSDKVNFLVKFYATIDRKYAKKLVSLLKSLNEKQIKQMISEIESEGFRIIVSQFTYNMFEKIDKLYKELNVDPYFYCEEMNQMIGGGVIYTMLLEHLAFKKLKHTSYSSVDKKTLQPLDGQRMGEMEMWTLASYDALNFLKESLTIRSDDILAKSKVISDLIRTGNSSLKTKLNPSTYLLFKAYMSLLGVEFLEDEE